MNRSFAALRGLAIFLVVLNHTIHMTEKFIRSQEIVSAVAWERFLFNFIKQLGVFAVPIFLFLSGAFFAYATSRGNLKTDYQIIWNNLQHIALPYVIWSMIFYLEILLLHGVRYTTAEYVKCLIVGYPYHFIPLLFFFYLASPLLIRMIRHYGWVVIGVTSFYQFILLNIVYPGILHITFPGWMRLLAPPVISNTLAEWAIFFPLGLFYFERITSLTEFIQKTKWVWAVLTILLYSLVMLDVDDVIYLPFLRRLVPIPFILLTAVIKRNVIPLYKKLEALGKNAYGMYLMNLLVLDVLIILINRFFTWMLTYYLSFILMMFFVTLIVLMWVINGFEKSCRPVLRRYVFG